MDKTDKTELAFKATEKMIADIEKNLQAAIRLEDWSRAAYLNAYINGMKQIEEIFRQAVG